MDVQENFFSRYEQFYETSPVSTKKKGGGRSQRLPRRWDGIVKANRPLFNGARVLDIGSHDGRWSMAALDAGASHVVGIEGRPELVARATRTLSGFGVPATRFRFITGDALAEMPNLHPGDYDLVLNLGFLYHTARHYDVFQEMHRLHPHAIIIDTRVSAGRGAIVRYKVEPHQPVSMSIRSTPGLDNAITGRPNHDFLVMMSNFFGYKWHLVDWTKIGSDTEGIEDYRKDTRRTYVLERQL